MARLFITPREIDFISDLTKEITKDVIGEKIYYYKIREDVSGVHDVYEESRDKVFDPPIEIDSRVNWGDRAYKTDRFGYEGLYTCEAYIHYRDMLDRGIRLQEGDYFSIAEHFFEITSIKTDKAIFGQVEHVTGFTLAGKQARKGLIDKKPLGPTEEIYTDSDAIQTDFEQQRGFSKNSNGQTGDKRQLQSDGIVESPISSPSKVVKSDGIKSSFYGDK